jgi:hypothetical protein
MNDLERDGTIVPEIVRAVDGRGAASAQERRAPVGLPLDPIPARQLLFEAFVHQRSIITATARAASAGSRS